MALTLPLIWARNSTSFPFRCRPGTVPGRSCVWCLLLVVRVVGDLCGVGLVWRARSVRSRCLVRFTFRTGDVQRGEQGEDEGLQAGDEDLEQCDGEAHGG